MNRTLKEIVAGLAITGVLYGTSKGIGQVVHTYARAQALEQELRQERESIRAKTQIVGQTANQKITVYDVNGNGLYDLIEGEHLEGIHLTFKQGEHGLAQSLPKEYTVETISADEFDARLESYFKRK